MISSTTCSSGRGTRSTRRRGIRRRLTVVVTAAIGAWLAARILTVKGNQPGLHQQLATLPWRLVPAADRDANRPLALLGIT